MTDLSPVDTPVSFRQFLVADVYSTSQWRMTFTDFLDGLGVDSSYALRTAIEVIETYSDDERSYHGALHLTNMWNDVIENAATLNLSNEETVAQMLAVPAHDIVYDVTLGPGVNEQRSAAWARDIYTDMQIPDAIIDRVEALILATTLHDVPTDDPDMSAFLDADMAIVQTPWAIYGIYAAGVIKEYVIEGNVDPLVYRDRRMKFLQGMIKRERVFSGVVNRYSDDRARSNMSRELGMLAGATSGLPHELVDVAARHRPRTH